MKKVSTRKLYPGCYFVINAKAQYVHDNEIYTTNIRVSRSLDIPKKWVVEGCSREHYISKKKALDAIANEDFLDTQIIWMTKDQSRNRRKKLSNGTSSYDV